MCEDRIRKPDSKAKTTPFPEIRTIQRKNEAYLRILCGPSWSVLTFLLAALPFRLKFAGITSPMVLCPLCLVPTFHSRVGVFVKDAFLGGRSREGGGQFYLCNRPLPSVHLLPSCRWHVEQESAMTGKSKC